MSKSKSFARLATRALLPFSAFAVIGISACSDSATSPILDAAEAKKPRAPKSDTVVYTPVTDTTTTPTSTPTASAFTALIGAKLYVDPNSNARKTADS
jgi:hypothetical protein